MVSLYDSSLPFIRQRNVSWKLRSEHASFELKPARGGFLSMYIGVKNKALHAVKMGTASYLSDAERDATDQAPSSHAF